MKKLLLLQILLFVTFLGFCQNSPVIWTDSVYTGKQGKFHIQGFTLDKANGFIYTSFTNKLLKMNLKGEVVASVIGIVGHLGDLEYNEKDGKIYASLEYKNDVIGKGINNTLGIDRNVTNSFYIAVFDTSKITEKDMHVDSTDILNGIYLHEVVNDHDAEVKIGNKSVKYRHGCSGIDGLTFAPAIGENSTDRNFLYVAYGVYGDTTRTDNDHQVILKFDPKELNKYVRPINQNRLHTSGPTQAVDKYFIKTGNTRFGIQNLSYDPYSGNLYAAVYKGSKSKFSNFDLFVINGHIKPFKIDYFSDGKKTKVSSLALTKKGTRDKSGILNGWHFKWGATGIQSLDNGIFYISHHGKSEDGQQQSTIYKYKWIGDSKTAFRRYNENK